MSQLEEVLKILGLPFDWKYIIEVLIKLCMISIVAFILGLNREKNNSAIGIKTLMIIGLTSCAITMISVDNAERFIKLYNLSVDPMRLPAQIVSGVGFLGAGVIFVRKNNEINGLTTAAMIWGVATLGIAVGAGYNWIAILSVIFMVSTVEIFPKFLDFFGYKNHRKYISEIYFIDRISLLNGLEILKNKNDILEYFIEEKENSFKLTLHLSITEEIECEDIYKIYLTLVGTKGFKFI